MVSWAPTNVPRHYYVDMNEILDVVLRVDSQIFVWIHNSDDSDDSDWEYEAEKPPVVENIVAPPTNVKEPM